jgi:hypothetical protein
MTSLIAKSQENCDFIQKVQIYQDSVKLIHIGDYDVIDSGTFDLKTYLSFFDSLEFVNKFRFNVYYFDNFLDGNPYLYALKENEKLVDKNKNALYKFLNNPDSRAKNHIKPKDSEIGYLQYLFFYEIGEQFALKWHSNYYEKRIICSSDQINKVSNELETSEMFSTDSIGLIKLKDVSPEIIIESKEMHYIISWLENRTHNGIFKCSYQIERNSPFRIIRIKEERLLEISPNFLY